MKRITIIAIIALLIVAAGAFVWFTWPKSPEPVVEEPIVEEPAPTTRTFASSTMGVSVTYPIAYTEGEHTYPFSSTKSIHGVRFTIPMAIATGTNLSSDSYVSVEQLPNARACTGDIYLKANVRAAVLTDGSVEYSVASSTGAAAGNRYEEWVFALKDSKPCTAVRYYIHSTVVENYPEDTVVAFNKDLLVQEFDQIRRSLQIQSQ